MHTIDTSFSVDVVKCVMCYQKAKYMTLYCFPNSEMAVHELLQRFIAV